MEQAIKKAIEGGYKGGKWNTITKEYCLDFFELNNRHKIMYSYLVDPLFWECLGKALGWKQQDKIKEFGDFFNYDYRDYMHSFIDHIADKGTPDDFFNKLLND